MANGIMAGSGTQTAPYLVEDVYDFCEMLNGTDGLYYKLVSNIDFNEHDTYKYGITGLIGNNNSRYLDGDGHEVRNMVCTNDSIKLQFNSGTISNTNFVNIIIKSVTYSGHLQIYASKFINCNFGYYLSNSAFKSIFNSSAEGMVQFTNCTFNIAGSLNIGNTFFAKFNMCHINFNNFTVNHTYLLMSDSYNTAFENTYVTGSIKSSTLVGIFDNSVRSIMVNNSYFSIDMSNNTTLKYLSKSNMSTELCLIDKTLMPNMTNTSENSTTTTISGLYRLTAEQFKDNDYLNSIGFLAIQV